MKKRGFFRLAITFLIIFSLVAPNFASASTVVVTEKPIKVGERSAIDFHFTDSDDAPWAAKSEK